MKKNNKLVIIISIILILGIVSAVFAYLYLMTDIFRTNQELFVKYFAKNIETLEKVTDLKTAEIYENLENENKYESNMNFKINYSEGGEISNPLNNLTAQIDIQKDNEQQYSYTDAKLLYEDETYLEAEYIEEQNVYGIRFPYAIQQFITAEEEENVENILEESNLLPEESENVLDLLENDERMANLKNRYLGIILNQIGNGDFQKQKNILLTYNNKEISTNVYSLLLNSEQVENILVDILNNMKTDQEILEIVNDKTQFEEDIDMIIENISEEIEIPEKKITIYKYQKNTVKTVFEIGKFNISIENIEYQNEIISKINISKAEDNTTIQFDIDKLNNENTEEFNFSINVVEGDEIYNIKLLSTMQQLNNEIKVDSEISYNKDITTISLTLENDIKVIDTIEKKETLTTENSRMLTSLEESKRSQMVEIIKNIVIEKTTERINLLMEKMNFTSSEESDTENGTSQIEINKFNAKFEFYTGDEVSTDTVKELLNVVKNNINSYEFVTQTTTENSENVSVENEKLNVKIKIEKDKTDEEGINKILEKISSNKKYKVTITYNDENGLIEYINIVEV